MLQSIHIQNYALIESLDIDFHSGFSVITGETGAGKSIILGAIGLLVGQRADSKAIKTGASKCVVEAHFNISTYQLEDFFNENDLEYDGEECILRREVHASGKSRAFINDTPASLVQMKALGEKLIDVHSQHQNLLLNHEDFQLNVLDILANSREALQTYKSLYNNYKQTVRELKTLVEEAEKNRQDEEYIRFQVQQLEDAHLQAGEQEELEQEIEMLTHAEDIKSSLFKVNQLMDEGEMNLVSLSKEAMQVLQSISRVYAPASEWSNRLESCYLELKDMAHEIAYASDEIEFNPTRLEYVNERLNLIYTLQQKHQLSSVEELLELAGKLNEKLDAITSSDDHIQELTKKKDLLYQQVLSQAEVLTRMRTEASKEIEAQMQAYLIPLGMPNVRFAVELSPRKEPDASGMDNVSFLFSANKNGTLQQVASIASGGEIARVMLSLKAMMARFSQMPTMVFDEIDTGVSGSVADKMGSMICDMGQHMQVFAITHLPQVAAKGSAHYLVEKQVDPAKGAVSTISRLSDEERVYELARMLSGSVLTPQAVENAKSLLQ